MKPVLNKILPLVLSLLVCLTGQGVAASRGVDVAVGQMVLCTGTGPVVVYMDADGQPVKAPHYCPDYALTLLGAVVPEEAAVQPRMRAALPAPNAKAQSLIAALVPKHPARAPPLAA